MWLEGNNTSQDVALSSEILWLPFSPSMFSYFIYVRLEVAARGAYDLFKMKFCRVTSTEFIFISQVVLPRMNIKPGSCLGEKWINNNARFIIMIILESADS